MVKKSAFVLAYLLLASAMPLSPAGAATPGYSTTDVNLRAGPSTGFPALGIIHAGSRVTIHGCISRYTWCDVSAGRRRGWMSGPYLQFDYHNRRVYVPAIVSRPEIVSIPIITFEIGDYWGSYYHDLEFYDELDYWDDYVWDDDGFPPGWQDDWDDPEDWDAIVPE